MPTQDHLARLKHPTRRRMLDAAETCFAGVGYDAARVDDIAAAAGVSKSHLYYHFPSKRDLMAGLVDLRVGEALELKDQIFREELGDGTAGRARWPDILAHAAPEALLPHRDFIRIILVEAIRHPEVAAPVFAAVDELLDDTVRRITQTDRHLDPERLRRLSFHFLLMPALLAAAIDENTLPPGLGMSSLIAELPDVEAALLARLDNRADGPADLR